MGGVDKHQVLSEEHACPSQLSQKTAGLAANSADHGLQNMRPCYGHQVQGVCAGQLSSDGCRHLCGVLVSSEGAGSLCIDQLEPTA
jgi:hypothetical protein